jgi:glycosyltransferase involved in cell wall biosynthesis
MQKSNSDITGTNTPRPKVSVCVVTYNQKNYIGECLQSLVDQITDFSFEVLVGDDCSTDGTSEIVADFANRYPHIVKHIRHQNNIGAYLNYKFIHREAHIRGEYVAHVDGDDYALPGKLARQVSILDSHPELALSAHAVKVVGQHGLIGAAAHLPEWGGIEDLLRLGTYFVNSSTMYRAVNHFNHDENIDVIDFYMHIEQASRGGIHLEKKHFGAYRWHAEGISKSKTHRKRIEQAYSLAFQRALQLGASVSSVKRGELIRRKSFAISRLSGGDLFGFRQLIALDFDEWPLATTSHRVLSAGRFFIQGFVAKYLAKKVSSVGD